MEDKNDEVWSEELNTSDFVRINLGRKQSAHPLPIMMKEDPRANETHTFPSEVPDWSNLSVLHRNTLPPRASFYVYDTVEDALTRDVAKSKTMLLSGTWKFNLSKSPFDAPPDFFDPKFDTSKWGDIVVPGMWQLQVSHNNFRRIVRGPWDTLPRTCFSGIDLIHVKHGSVCWVLLDQHLLTFDRDMVKDHSELE